MPTLTAEQIREACPMLPDTQVSDLLRANEMTWGQYKGFQEKAIFDSRMFQISQQSFAMAGMKNQALLTKFTPIIENAALFFKHEVLEGGSLGGIIAKGAQVFDIRLIDTTSCLDGKVSQNRACTGVAGTAINLIPNDANDHYYVMGDGTTKKQEWVIMGFYDPAVLSDINTAVGVAGTRIPMVEQVQVDVNDESVPRMPMPIWENQLTDFPFVPFPLTWVRHDLGVDIDMMPRRAGQTLMFPFGVEFITADKIADLV